MSDDAEIDRLVVDHLRDRQDRAAWACLRDALNLRLLRMLRAMGASWEDAEDAVGEVWLDLVRERVPLGAGPAMPLLYAVARNKLLTLWRRRAREAGPLPDDGPAVGDGAGRADSALDAPLFLGRLAHCWEAIGEADRSHIRARFPGGLERLYELVLDAVRSGDHHAVQALRDGAVPYARIAARTGGREQAARRRFCVAMRALRRCLEAGYGGTGGPAAPGGPEKEAPWPTA